MSRFRALTRLTTECVRSSECDHSSPAFRNYTRFVLKSAEHTWGDYGNSDYDIQIATWVEQRTWAIDVPLSALPASHPIVLGAASEFAALTPTLPDLSAYKQVLGSGGGKLSVEQYVVEFGADGAIHTLYNSDTKRYYAQSGQNALGLLVYQVWDVRSVPAAWTQNRPAATQTAERLGDPQCTDESAAILIAVWQGVDNSSSASSTTTSSPSPIHSFFIHTTLPPYLAAQYGGWREAWTQLTLDTTTATLDYTVTLWHKNATRTPEAAFFVFQSPPPYSPPLISKLNTWVDISDVIQGGSRHLHAADFGGVRHAGGLYTSQSLDCPFVSIGYVTPFPQPYVNFTDMGQARNVSWGIVNNAWFTNYPQSYPFVAADENIQSRFRLILR